MPLTISANSAAEFRIMKVLIADKFEQSGIDGLKAAGCEVVYQPDLKDEALATAIRDSGAEILIVRGTPVDRRDARRRCAVADCSRRCRVQHRSTSPPPHAAASTCRIVLEKIQSPLPN